MVVVGVGAEEDGEVGSGGEAHDADVGGVDVPVGGVGAGEAHGLLGILEVRGVGGIVAGFADGLGDAIFDQDAGDSNGVEPVAGVGAFAIGYKDLVASAGKDEDGGAGALAVGRVDGEGGDGDVGEADDAMAADEAVGGLGEVGLGGGGLGGLGSGVGPEGQGHLLGLRVRVGSECESEDCGAEERECCGAEEGRKNLHADHLMPSAAPTARAGTDGGGAWQGRGESVGWVGGVRNMRIWSRLVHWRDTDCVLCRRGKGPAGFEYE